MAKLEYYEQFKKYTTQLDKCTSLNQYPGSCDTIKSNIETAKTNYSNAMGILVPYGSDSGIQTIYAKLSVITNAFDSLNSGCDTLASGIAIIQSLRDELNTLKENNKSLNDAYDKMNILEREKPSDRIQDKSNPIKGEDGKITYGTKRNERYDQWLESYGIIERTIDEKETECSNGVEKCNEIIESIPTETFTLSV